MRELQRRLVALSEEIRAYPTPIARCDEQLTALLEQRASIMEQIRQAASVDATRQSNGCSSENTWINDGGFNAA